MSYFPAVPSCDQYAISHAAAAAVVVTVIVIVIVPACREQQWVALPWLCYRCFILPESTGYIMASTRILMMSWMIMSYIIILVDLLCARSVTGMSSRIKPTSTARRRVHTSVGRCSPADDIAASVSLLASSIVAAAIVVVVVAINKGCDASEC